MICIHTQFHMRRPNALLSVAINLKTKRRFHAATRCFITKKKLPQLTLDIFRRVLRDISTTVTSAS